MAADGAASGSAGEGRVLILAPVGRDAESIAALVAGRGHGADVCADVAALAEAIGPDVGTVVVTEESLRRGTDGLFARLAAQPAWSDIPFVYLAGPRRAQPQSAPHAAALPDGLRHGMVLERPLGTQSLLSAIEWGLSARRRQYQIRDQLEQMREQTRLLSEAAQRISESEVRFRAITESMPQIVWSATHEGHHDYFNRRFMEYTGVAKLPLDRPPRLEIVHPDDRVLARTAWRHALATGAPYQVEYRMRHRSGAYRWHLAQAVPLVDDGRVVRWFGTCTDIDDQVRARESLAKFNERLEREVGERTVALHDAMGERQRAEDALRQSQKMDAIGQLTGGIAHDFNNFLTGVIGSIDIVKRRLSAGRTDDIERFMNTASSSAQRAATLTHRLLAFSRQQTLAPRPVALNALVESMHELLVRSVHESIAIETRFADALPPALADENQVESALLNLVINARDAMPDGGTLTISTDLVTVTRPIAERVDTIEPGQYIELAVADTGVGMSDAVLSRALEPFFTTKPIGQGTGLGLSTIYGFARQSRGYLLVDSTEGAGTKVRLLLPQADAIAPQELGDDAAATPPGSGETILVVEDDPAVRALVVNVLGELGYSALEAEDARSAFVILGSGQPLDLMISDVGLPGMNGRQLADIARSQRHGLKVLFITGYAGSENVRLAGLEDGMSVLTKPFTVDLLSTRIRTLMH